MDCGSHAIDGRYVIQKWARIGAELYELYDVSNGTPWKLIMSNSFSAAPLLAYIERQKSADTISDGMLSVFNGGQP